MQNKGAIRLLAIVFALISLYQLSFTFFGRKVERDAVQYAKSEIARLNMDPENQVVFDSLEQAYLDSLECEEVYNFLWLKRYNYKETRDRELNLGLDLKGGMNVILEIAVDEVINSLASPTALADTSYLATMQLALQKKANSDQDLIDLFREAYEEKHPGGTLAEYFQSADSREIDFNSTNDEVVEYLKTQADDVIENSYNVLRNRIDRFGVVQLNIQRLDRQGRIQISLPGIDDKERITDLLTKTANLQFWTCYQNTEVWGAMEEANRVLAEMQNSSILPDDLVDDAPEAAEETEAPQDDILTDVMEDDILSDTAGDLLDDDIITDPLLDEEAQYNKENPLFAVLKPYVNSQRQMIPSGIIGVVEIKDTAKVMNYLEIERIKDLFPPDLKFAWHFQTLGSANECEEGSFIYLYTMKGSRDNKPVLDGEVVTDARVTTDPYTGQFQVSMSMNSEGAKEWAKITRQNVNKPIAIEMDGVVYSAPNVSEEIKGGSSSISGNFTQEEANDLSIILKSGKMSARAIIESSEVIGPSLGAKSVRDGLHSFLIAFVVIMLYMVFYYSRRAGLVADIALMANMFFLMGVLASLQAALTLPGIAGIVLTIGMSVDANVLIYERIREELASGKGKKLALKDGYRNAYSAIIDANVTTFLTGLILFSFGTGPIKGFATTLVIGIVTSLFSAVVLTRLVYEWWLSKDWTLTFSTKLTKNAFSKVNIDFLGKRKLFYVISSIVIVLGITSIAVRGLNGGVDFTGGRNYVVQFKNEVAVDDVRNMLTESLEEAPTVISIGQKSNNRVRITTKYMIQNDSTHIDSLVIAKIFTGLQPVLDEGATLDKFINSTEYIESSYKVGPTIADDIKRSSVWVVIISLGIIFLYILIRFRNWQFGLGALGALVHDVLIVIGLFSLLNGVVPFSLEIDQAFIAAILTVVGYSINDTVVVFDRIREFVGLQRKRERKDIFNSALNSTLSRTFSTSLSTFFVLLTIFLFGGDVIRGFIFALLIGVVVGTYSSLFIATPIVYDSIRKDETKRVVKGVRKK